jgi:hypothetical protein
MTTKTTEVKHLTKCYDYDPELMAELIIGCYDELGYVSPTDTRHAYTKVSTLAEKIRCATEFLEGHAEDFGLERANMLKNRMSDVIYVVDEADVPKKIGIPIKLMQRLNLPIYSSYVLPVNYI